MGCYLSIILVDEKDVDWCVPACMCVRARARARVCVCEEADAQWFPFSFSFFLKIFGRRRLFVSTKYYK